MAEAEPTSSSTDDGGLPRSAWLEPGNIPLSSAAALPAVVPATEGGPSSDELFKRAPREPHTWTRGNGEAFNVRRGPNYREKRKKAASGPSLYDIFAVDVHSSQTKLAHIGRAAALPADPSPPPRDSGIPPYVIINWMVPNYPPSGLLAPKRSNGPGWNLVQYARLSDQVREVLQQKGSADGGGGGGSSSSGGGVTA